MAVVVKISKSGVSVLTGGDADMVFTSTLNALKVKLTGTTTVATGAGADGTTSVAHGLSATPALVAFCKTDNGASGNWEGYAWNDPVGFWFFADTTNLKFRCWGVANVTKTVRYYAMADPVS